MLIGVRAPVKAGHESGEELERQNAALVQPPSAAA
jgi:hypothetical protein